MDFGIVSVAAITVIAYLAGMICKAVSDEIIPDKVIPVVCGLVGGLFGIIGLNVMPDFPAHDLVNALAIGIVSGLAATGVNQIGKQLSK